MSTLQTIQGTDLITNSRANLNDNFAALNADKLETSVLDSDTTLAANSDSKVPTQKAVKAYVDAGGNPDIAAAQAGGGDFGTPSATNKFITEDKLDTQTIVTLTTTDSLDGSTTPVPVFIHSDGMLVLSDANDANRLLYHGLSKTNASSNQVSYLGSASGTSTTLSVTVPAGTNRYLVAFALIAGTSPTLPTGATWNSLALTSIKNDTSNSARRVGVWGLALGTGSETTANLVFSGYSGTLFLNHAHVYQNVDQSSPYNDSDSASANAASVTTPSITKSNFGAMYVYGVTSNGGAPVLATAGTTTRQSTDAATTLSGDVYLYANSTVSATRTGSDNICIAGVVLNGHPLSCTLYIDKKVNGFTGLTPGAKYYVSNSSTLSTTPGDTSIPVGTALSATEILTKQTYP